MIFCIGSHDLLYWITWSLILDHMISCIGSHDLKSHPQTTFFHEEKRSSEPSGISSNIQTFCDIQEILKNPRLAEMQKIFTPVRWSLLLANTLLTGREGHIGWAWGQNAIRIAGNFRGRKHSWILSFLAICESFLSKIWERGTWQHQQAIRKRFLCWNYILITLGFEWLYSHCKLSDIMVN